MTGIDRRYIVLKADDLVFDPEHVISPNWQRFIDHIENRRLKANLGLIGNSLERGTEAYCAKIRALAASGCFEIWNHGYDHSLGRYDAGGNRFWEYRNRSAGEQKASLERTQELARAKLGLTLGAFGAPGNRIDGNTAAALESVSDIKVWFFGEGKTSKLVLERHADIEHPVHHPSYEKFIEGDGLDQRCLTLQIHPASWDDRRFGEFTRIIEYLVARRAEFVTATEYYRTQDERYR